MKPRAVLIADTQGNLFGTSRGESDTVLEVIGSGFVLSLRFVGTTGTPLGFGESVLALLRQDHTLDAAAQNLRFDHAETSKAVIRRYCTVRATAASD